MSCFEDGFNPLLTSGPSAWIQHWFGFFNAAVAVQPAELQAEGMGIGSLGDSSIGGWITGAIA